MLKFKEYVETDEALTMQQRRKRSIQMKKMKTKLAMGRKRQSTKLADKDRLMKRARKAARAKLASKLTKGVSPSDLSPARKASLEKRLDKMGKRVTAIAKKMVKDKRKSELLRKRG